VLTKRERGKTHSKSELATAEREKLNKETKSMGYSAWNGWSKEKKEKKRKKKKPMDKDTTPVQNREKELKINEEYYLS
jgi:hypothetical protein